MYRRLKTLATYLESLVLEDTLNRCVLVGGRQFRLKDDAKGAIAYNFALGVLQVPRFSGHSILNLFVDNLCMSENIGVSSRDESKKKWRARQ